MMNFGLIRDNQMRILLVICLNCFMGGCAPNLKGMCTNNEECIENYLCNEQNQCIAVDQKNLEMSFEKLNTAIVGEKYFFELMLRGGLKPYSWRILNGPKWMRVEKNPNTESWRLIGTPDSYQHDAVAVKLDVTDSSIGGGQSITSENLSIRVGYCSSEKDQNDTCYGNGSCNEKGRCDCDEGYAGHWCGECDVENGYQRNEVQQCVKYTFFCSTQGVCGSDVHKCECVGQTCEDVEDCDLVMDCADSTVCWVDDEKYGCDGCQGFGCTDGKCNGCNEGVCCDNGALKPPSEQCNAWFEYRCKESICGAERQKGTFVQRCDGQTTGCNGVVIEQWESLPKCQDNEVCSLSTSDTPPICVLCEHGCNSGQCWPECDPSKNGCCTSDGYIIDGCWFDPEMKLSWQVNPFGKKVWSEAKYVCETFTLGDRSDWRLPNINELRSLVKGCAVTDVTPFDTGDCQVLDDSCLQITCSNNGCGGCDNNGTGPGQNGCYWDPNINGGCSSFWSSSEVVEGAIAPSAWFVFFQSASVCETFQDVEIDVRCVRSGT